MGLKWLSIAKVRRVVILGLVGAFLSAIGVLGLRGYSALQAKGQIYMIDRVPDRPVAIVFGAWVYDDGSPSPMLADRVAAAVKLYQTGNFKARLLTGDNHITTNDEPTA